MVQQQKLEWTIQIKRMSLSDLRFKLKIIEVALRLEKKLRELDPERKKERRNKVHYRIVKWKVKTLRKEIRVLRESNKEN